MRGGRREGGEEGEERGRRKEGERKERRRERGEGEESRGLPLTCHR